MTNEQMIQNESNTKSNNLYIAFELSNTNWKLMFSDGMKRRLRDVSAGDLGGLLEEIKKAKERFKLSGDVEIYSCYEAGRDGFWIHRYLKSQGLHNYVVDSSSIEVPRRFRRAKTDRIDAGKLLNMLLRHLSGEKKLWSIVHIPSVESEDMRRLNREEDRLKKERSAHSCRIKSLLVLHGIRISVNQRFLENLEHIFQWDGKGLPARLKTELIREYKRYELTREQLKELKKEKKEVLASKSKAAKQTLALRRLKGIGEISSWDLVFEFFGWRKFKNVKQVGGASGLVPTPYNSGGTNREQGISKSGNRRIRRLMIQIAWYWVRYQPQSKLSRWYNERFGGGGKRMRKVGIVAVARKLLVALWKYLEQGLVPEGAVLKEI